MLKSFLILNLIFTFSWSAYSQHTLTGRVIDEKKQPLSYATVALLNPADSLLQYFGVTNEKGEYQIKRIKKGTYLIQFSYVGMKTVYDQLSIPLASGERRADQQLVAELLNEVVVEAELIPVKFKNDTLEFDAKAFQTRPGAAAEELLRQLPGVEVDNAGNIKAEGEEVTKVLVDGKEFFDNDPKVATKNLPAKALSKVQVIDRKTEEAVFSGIDDGIREKTINLKLKEDHKKGYFGEVAAGIGAEDAYKLEGRIYSFTKKTQAALLGSYNNINEFGFTNKDNNQFGLNNKGINTALSGGFNFSYNPNSKNRYFLNYLGNRREKDLQEEIHTENFLSDGTYEQDQDITQSDIDQPHRLRLGVRHNFNEQQRLIVDGNANINTSDIFIQSLTRSQLENQLINTLDNETNDASEVLSGNVRASYINKVRGDYTQLRIEAGGNLNDQSNQLDWINTTRFFDPVKKAVQQQFQANDRNRLALYAEPSLLQKLSPAWSLSLGARVGLEDNGLDRSEGMLNDQSEFEELIIPEIEARQRFVRPLLILNRTGEKASLNIRLESVVNQFERELNSASIRQDRYFFFTPKLNYQIEYKSGRRIDLRLSSDVNMPGPEQLIPVRNAIDQLNIVEGNPELEPEQNYSLFTRWTVFDQFSFTSFSLRLSGAYTRDKIRWAQTINPDLVKVSRPINIDQEANANLGADFSTPLRSLGLNLSLYASENWNRNIVFINEEENINTLFTHSLYMALENRKNEVFSLRLSGAISLTDSRFSIAEDQNNLFFNTTYSGDLRFTPGRKWNVEFSADIVNFNAQSFDEAVSVPLLEANISYFFLQAEKASVTLSGFDLLNQFTGFQRNSSANFLMERQWNTLNRYFMLTFNLRFR
jgi:hypothetical protein